MARESVKVLVRGAAALALVAGLMAVSACGTDQQAKQRDQTSQQTRTAEQTSGSDTSNAEIPPFAPEVAEEPAADYAPNIDPSDFVKGVDNPYFPLQPGTTLVYEGVTEDGTERVEDTVLRETKTIMGVECTVLHDKVFVDGEKVEDTLDWHAQDKEGNVWYFGESSRELENGKIVSRGGSFEAGKDGALPGIIMPADPKVGDSYRQEYYRGEAEDMAEVISLDGAALNDAVVTPHGSFGEDVLVTKDWNPLEPNILEHKYYAPGIGLIGEIKATGPSEKVELIDIQKG